jgi:hypothetical protein
MGVSPWKLARKSVKWRNLAIASESAEAWAEEQRAAKRTQKTEAEANMPKNRRR